MQETEAKFYVQDLNKIKTRLEVMAATLIQERVLEKNFRFDLPDASLSSNGCVLRLRQDTGARLTYKSAGTNEGGVLSRREIEFTVEDFERAKDFLEALGYQKLFYYEKYRTTYDLQSLHGFIHIMLDELPYGSFIEIEGATVQDIRTVAEHLHLHWGAAIAASYHALFERGRTALEYSFQDLSFENFENIQLMASDLGVRPADEEIT